MAGRPQFFLPVRVLSRYFRRTFLRLLRVAFAQGKLAPTAPADWAACLGELGRVEWVVDAKPPFGGPRQVLKYLARYTHRVAIANQRLVAVTEGHVQFRWTDYAHGHRPRTMTLDHGEFLRRFLLHALPRGFQHIRQYGFLANRRRAAALPHCRALLGVPPPADGTPIAPSDQAAPRGTCPHCGSEHLVWFALPVDPPTPCARSP